MAATGSKNDYQKLHAGLEEVLAKLQDPDIQIDQAIALYEQGLKHLDMLEKHLKSAEIKLTKLKLKQSEL